MRTLAVSKLSAAALLGALALLAAACASDSSPSPTPSPETKDFGPLVVVDSNMNMLALGGTGPVHIGERCVTMASSNGEEYLLVWPKSNVSWDGDRREITFTSALNAEPVTIRDGDIIAVGGGSLDSEMPAGVTPTLPATAGPGCTGTRWLVSSVTKQ